MIAAHPVHPTEFERTALLLGGARLLKRDVVSRLDAMKCLPKACHRARLALLNRLEVLQLDD